MFQIAEAEDSVTERHSSGCRKILQKEHLPNFASSSEKRSTQGKLSVAVDGSERCGSDERGLGARTPGLILRPEFMLLELAGQEALRPAGAVCMGKSGCSPISDVLG